MALLWVICGVGRGVGKTRLALRLCEVLPGSVYAKLGHGVRKPGKPKNLFHTEDELLSFLEDCRDSYEHLVAEANPLARRGAGDIIILVDGTPIGGEPRDDADLLRANAHIHLHAGGSADDWGRVLGGKLGDGALVSAVCDALQDQKQFLADSSLAVRTKTWLVVGEKRALGPGLARLLEGIDQHRTLRASAESAQMSYRYAWGLIKAAEERLGQTLITPRSGGLGGGESVLTANGHHLLNVLRRVSKEVAAYADERFAIHYAGEIRDDTGSDDDTV